MSELRDEFVVRTEPLHPELLRSVSPDTFLGMQKAPLISIAICVSIALSTTHARADAGSLRAAGFAILGIGGALGLGSIATGAALADSNNSKDEQRLANATWIGGAVTVGVSLAVGIPLVLQSDSHDSKSAAKLVDALSGRVRF